MTKRPTKPFAVERRTIKGDNNPRRPDRHWREQHESWKAEQKAAAAKPSPVVSEIEAYVEEIKRLHNDHDALRSLAIRAVNLKHAEKSAHHMEQFPNGVLVHAKPGQAQHLGLRLGLAMPAVPMEVPDDSLPKMPKGYAGFIRDLKK
jgi:hypothetical protein